MVVVMPLTTRGLTFSADMTAAKHSLIHCCTNQKYNWYVCREGGRHGEIGPALVRNPAPKIQSDRQCT